MRLWLPFPPENVTNPRRRGLSRAAHIGKARAKQAYHKVVALRVQSQVGTIRTFPCPVWIQYTLHVRAKYDDDNATALTKWVTDALVHAGLLKHDKRSAVRLHGIPHQEVLGPVRKRKGESEAEYHARRIRRDWQLGVQAEIWMREGE